MHTETFEMATKHRTPAFSCTRLLQPLIPYLYLAPALITIGIFVYLPVVRTLQISFYQWNLVSPTQRFVGWDNYARILRDPATGAILLQSAEYLLLAVLGNVVVPISLAFLTLQLADREVDFYQSVLFLPTVLAFNTVILIWIYFYQPNWGLFNALLHGLNLPGSQWLQDSSLALPAISLVANWKQFGFHFLIAIAGLKAIPKDYLEAAYVDGAYGWTLLRRVVLPLFGPTALFLLVVTLMQGLDYVFIPIDIMTSGGPANATNNLSYGIFQEGFKYFRAGYASALSVIMMVLLSGLIVWQFRLFNRRVTYER